MVGGGEGGCQTDASAVVGWLVGRSVAVGYHHGERSGSAALLVLATCVLNGSVGAFTTNLPVVEDVQQPARRAAGEWWQGRKGLTKPGPARFVVDLRCSGLIVELNWPFPSGRDAVEPAREPVYLSPWRYDDDH